MLLLSSILALVAAKTKRKFFFKNGTRDTRTGKAICRSKTELSLILPSPDARLERFTNPPIKTTQVIQTVTDGLKVEKGI